MPARKSPAQIKAELRRIQQKQRQAVNNYNRAADKFNRDLRRAVNDHNARVRRANQAIGKYNSAARAHNAQVRANRDRLRRELSRLGTGGRTSTTRTTYRTSVDQFAASYRVLEQGATTDGWADTDIFGLSTAEAANSVAALNALLSDAPEDATDQEITDLQSTAIADELADLSSDLDHRWRGALFALDPRNPDAARHFCTSAREMLTGILSTVAPTDQVLAANPNCERTQDGKITRRSRIHYCLRRSGLDLDGLADFVESDIDNVLALFREFNSGTHGSAGRFNLEQLKTLKARVEDAILFVLRIAA